MAEQFIDLGDGIKISDRIYMCKPVKRKIIIDVADPVYLTIDQFIKLIEERKKFNIKELK